MLVVQKKKKKISADMSKHIENNNSPMLINILSIEIVLCASRPDRMSCVCIVYRREEPFDVSFGFFSSFFGFIDFFSLTSHRLFCASLLSCISLL